MLSARLARVVEREHRAIVRRDRDDDLGDALFFGPCACTHHAELSPERACSRPNPITTDTRGGRL